MQTTIQTRQLTRIALLTAMLCILAPISIPVPISPVALTLGTFALYLTAYVLPPKQAMSVVGLYLLIGAAGLPVFSGYTGGISRFAAAGGGYLVSYLSLVGISSYSIRHFDRAPLQILGMLLATILTYSIGTAWTAYVTGGSCWTLLPTSILLFLPFDSVKLLIAHRVGKVLCAYLDRKSSD